MYYALGVDFGCGEDTQRKLKMIIFVMIVLGKKKNKMKDKILKLIKALWERYPEQRLGQLLENYVFDPKKMFYQEDKETEKRLSIKLEETIFKKGLNVIVSSDRTAKPYMKKLERSIKKFSGFVILDDSDIKEIRTLKREGTNIIIHTHNDKIIDIADHLFGLTKNKIVGLKK